jgi:hypothetical protein
MKPNRVHFRYGLRVCRLLLSTLPFDNAVTVGYKPENVYLERTSTALIVYHFRRTSGDAPRRPFAKQGVLCDPVGRHYT